MRPGQRLPCIPFGVCPFPADFYDLGSLIPDTYERRASTGSAN
ncbi:hypothetical protein ANACOL_01978 [Anaerotruncus colihominis DSM 17241]|uniref:Spore coat associated protein JA (CotJA) n=1 Tax=Anaerotruncus colihominis DSM 17241 TaxID=445972 RepID=B0PB27_9FIRM|nr:hypothetical protein ANACOL_01978 [Anaerotruncus colihominis DSM 17241]